MLHPIDEGLMASINPVHLVDRLKPYPKGNIMSASMRAGCIVLLLPSCQGGSLSVGSGSIERNSGPHVFSQNRCMPGQRIVVKELMSALDAT